MVATVLRCHPSFMCYSNQLDAIIQYNSAATRRFEVATNCKANALTTRPQLPGAENIT